MSPGTPLRQRELAEWFAVSYTPVREALRRLESEGLVVTDVHRGATVARTESEELEENYQILAALEVLAGRPQAGRPYQESVRQHDALVRALEHRNEEQVAAIIRAHVLGSIKYLPQ
jgi:DNA-binding GntR family transcriptional regulator